MNTWIPLVVGACALMFLTKTVPALIDFAKHRRAIRRRWRQFTAYSIILIAQVIIMALTPFATQSITLFYAQAACVGVWSALLVFVPCGMGFFRSGWGLIVRNGVFLACAALIFWSL